jgi:hypothetical protein
MIFLAQTRSEPVRTISVRTTTRMAGDTVLQAWVLSLAVVTAVTVLLVATLEVTLVEDNSNRMPEAVVSLVVSQATFPAV